MVHTSYFLRIAEEAGAHLAGPDESRWLDLLFREQDNFRAALRWAIDDYHPDVGLRLGAVEALRSTQRLWPLWGQFGVQVGSRRFCECTDGLLPSIHSVDWANESSTR